jgi:hypothetical protein
MANTLSNLYVERASSEHPLALWSLNEENDYFSLISDEERKLYLFNQWEIVEGEATSYPSEGLLNTPFINSDTIKFEAFAPDSQTGSFFAKGKFNFIPRLAQGFESLSFGFFAYVDSARIETVSFGYTFLDFENNEQEVVSTFPISVQGGWEQFLDTFVMPPSNAQNAKFIIRFTTRTGGIEGDYNVYLNGIAAGHWAEDFMSTSFGVTPSSMPADIALPSTLKVYPAFPYGGSGDVAYYISSSNRLRSKNFGIPLVYGSSEVTKVYPNNVGGVDYPSLIFPGYGFLNQRGKNNDYTVEMWLRINSASSSTKKIFGPIASEDGLYVDGSFLTLRIGNAYGSHFVGEWYRPMLIHIRIVKGTAVVVINGEEVISLDVDDALENLPQETLDNKNQDWLGVYAYQDIPLIDMDSFSIYPYGIPTQVSKRRFVWGQAVPPPEQTNSAVNAVTAFNDYAFANYAANYNYPDFANWRQAFFSNVNTDARALRMPQYQLPAFRLVDRTVQDLFNELQNIQATSDSDDQLNRKYFTLGLDESPEEHLYFEDLQTLNDKVSTVYGVFKTNGLDINKPLIKITNKNSKDSIAILINGTEITYVSDINNVITVIATKTVAVNKKFTVGINLKNMSNKEIFGIKAFFTDTASLDMYVAGDGTSKFTGKIYKVGFDAGYNNKNIESYYGSDGAFLHGEITAEAMYKHTANYTLVPINKYGVFFADIAVSGYWEDYVPLSYFAKYVLDSSGNKRYDLDFLQFNLDFPEPNSQTVIEEVGEWDYAALKARYSSPQLLQYRDLNNKFFTKWENYQDMSEDSVKTIFFNTENATLRSYISFQQLTDGANKNLIDFEEKAKPLANEVVDPDTSSFDWTKTAYEITTGSIIYPPKTVRRLVNNVQQNKPINFKNLAIVYHLDFKSEGIVHQPIKIKELQLASQVFERTRLTPVGSKFGVPVFYYNKPGFYFDLKGKNPIATYKKSTPHLYLNRQSGWKLRGDFDLNTDRGLAMPINRSAAKNTEVSSVQLWVRFSEKEFPGERVKIFSITHNFGVYDFYMEGDPSLLRAEIFGIQKETGELLKDLNYFVNGKKMIKPYIVKEEWAVLSVEFPDLLNFSGKAGVLNLNGPLTYNNMSYNLATNLERNISIEERTWEDLQVLRTAKINAAVSSGKTWYFSQTTPNVNNYKSLELGITNSKPQVIIPVTIDQSSLPAIIEEFVTEPGVLNDVAPADPQVPNIIQFPNGEYKFNFWAKVDDIDGLSTIRFDIYARNISGSETILASTQEYDISFLTATAYNATLQINNTPAKTINKTDRIVVKVIAKTNSPTNKTISFIHSGTTPSSFVTAISPGKTTYSVDKNFAVGETVDISGITPAGYNGQAVITEVSTGKITIAKTIFVPYVSGGDASVSSWRYAETDLVVRDNKIKPPFTWQQVKTFSQSRSFNINPESIYSKYTGSDRIIIDDESNGILVQPDQFTLYSDIVWKESTKIPV